VSNDRYQRLNDERRARVYTIDQRHAIDLLQLAIAPEGGLPGTLCVPREPRVLPRDALIVNSTLNFYNRQFEFLVYHETFDPVPVGALPPTWPDPLKLEVVSVLIAPEEPKETGE